MREGEETLERGIKQKDGKTLRTVCDEFSDHRVVKRRNRVALGDTRVHSHIGRLKGWFVPN